MYIIFKLKYHKEIIYSFTRKENIKNYFIEILN